MGGAMNRRSFLFSSASTILVSAGPLKAWGTFRDTSDAKNEGAYEALLGQPADLASFGDLQSWISPESTRLIRKSLGSGANPRGVLKLFDFPWREEQFDLGVEWPEFRTVDKVVLKFVAVFMAMGHKAGANRAIPPLKSEVPYKSEVG